MLVAGNIGESHKLNIALVCAVDYKKKKKELPHNHHPGTVIIEILSHLVIFFSCHIVKHTSDVTHISVSISKYIYKYTTYS
jgi:hypothetical protein